MEQLFPHQKEAVAKLDNGKILWGQPGVGKSITAVGYYLAKEAPKDVYVITTAKKRDSLDWQTEFAKLGIGREAIPTFTGKLTVDSWNNIGLYRDIAGSFFIFDEQRLVGSGHWTDVFLRIVLRNRWILLSATPGDTWMDYIPVFVANGFYRNRTEFKREHVVYNSHTRFPKVDRYVNVGRLVRHRNEILVEMPYHRHTVRRLHDVVVDYDKEIFEKVAKKRWHVFEERPLRDVAELFVVMRRVVNSSPTRLKAIQDLMKKHPRLIVFYNFDFELEILRSLASLEQGTEPCPIHSPVGIASLGQELTSTRSKPSSSVLVAEPISTKNGLTNEGSGNSTKTTKCGCTFQLAEYNGHKHDPIPKGNWWVYLVQYAAGAEGWNCTTTDTTCFYSMPYSYKLWHQAHGRTDRLNTPYLELYYYTLTSRSPIDQGITKALLNKKSFNESQFFKHFTYQEYIS